MASEEKARIAAVSEVYWVEKLAVVEQVGPPSISVVQQARVETLYLGDDICWEEVRM